MKFCCLRLACFTGLTIFLLSAAYAPAQIMAVATATVGPVSALPKVTQIDNVALAKLVKPNGKPLIINFWATWCDPCREEFPDLVKIDAAYRGKVDFLTVSLDDLEDKDTVVPKFLNEMKAAMPTYLLITPDEDAAMRVVTPEWAGNLPMTIIFAPNGSTAYLRKGKIRVETLSAEIDKLLAPSKTAQQ